MNDMETNPCICPNHFPEVMRLLSEMRKEIIHIVKTQPYRRQYILNVIKQQIRKDIVEKRLRHGRCLSVSCYSEVPAMSRHFICTADQHTIPFPFVKK